MTDERDEKHAPEPTEQRTEVEKVQRQPVDPVEQMRAWMQSAPQTGQQIQFSAVFSQTVPADAWTAENLRAAIDGMVRQGDQNHELWRDWNRHFFRRSHVELAAILALALIGIGLAVFDFRWGVDITVGAMSFYAGVLAGRGQK